MSAWTPPTFALGPLESFASAADFRREMGDVRGVDNERWIALALLAGTRHVLLTTGYAFDEQPVPPDVELADLVIVESVASWRIAAAAAAVRFYKSMAVPFGVAGGWDMATYVRMSIPDVDLLLVGERVAFGIA